MSPWELAGTGAAGAVAGFVNAVAGSGTLVTFPTLLAFGVPPVTANVSNNIGLVPGSVSAAWGLRRELSGQRRRTRLLLSASLVGGVSGAVLLLVLPSEAFGAIVPVLVGLGVLLVAVQPLVTRAVARRREGREPADGRWLWPAVAGTGVYGGYFGAVQGILLLAVLGLGTPEPLHRTNAVKNVLAAVVNGVAAAVFAVVAPVDWGIVAVIAVGSVLGGQAGARVGRRLPAAVLRAFIVVVGLTALAVFLLR